MAVVNAYVTHNASGLAVDKDIAARCLGGVVKCLPFSFEVAAADDNASIYRFAKGLSPRAIPLSLIVYCDAIAGLTDPQFGTYKSLDLGGAVIDVDALVDSVDIHAGQATLTEMLIPSGLAIDAVGKDLLTLSGVADADKDKYGGIDLAMTTPTGVSAAGTVSGFFFFIDGV